MRQISVNDLYICSYEVHALLELYLLDKVLGGLHVHLLAVTQGTTEQQSLLHSGGSCVSVKLLHIARHSGKAGLLLGVAIDTDVTLNPTSCTIYQQASADEAIVNHPMQV